MSSAPFRLNRSGILLAVVSAAFATEAGAAAGRAEFTIGGVTVARGGVERPLARGTELDNGDVVRTNDGRAQIRFTDGAYVSLQPNTEYGIRDYQYTQGNERGFFSLLKGAMRTVTGAIGRINRDRFQIATPTATVGIRGTGGVIQVQDDGSTLVVGTSGIWSLTNPSGSVDVPAGTSAVAPSDPNQPPQETTQQPASGPAPVPEEQPQFVQGEEVDEEGLPIIPPPSFTPLVTGSGYAAVVAWEAFGLDAINSGDAVFDSAGRMTQLTSVSPPADIFFGVYELVDGTHSDFGTDGVLAWGRWSGNAISIQCEGPCTFTLNENQGLHYVVGIPTPSLPTTGSGTFSLLGATRPTYVDGLSAPGTFTGSMTVTFGPTPTIGADFSVAMPEATYRLVFSPSRMQSASSFFSFSPTVTVGGQPCGASACTSSVQGFFAGTSADRIGVGYHVRDDNTSRDVLGTAGFQKQ
jgi:hypothetical protein